MRNLVDEIQSIEKDGTYYILPERIDDYAARWSYGYIVGVRPLEITDLRNFTLFGRWTDDSGKVFIDLVKHIGAKRDAIKLARDYEQTHIFDLRDNKAVTV